MLGLPGHLGQQLAPAAQQLSHRVPDVGVRPAGRDHLLQHPHVAGVEVVLQVVAGPLVSPPQRFVLRVHSGLALEAAPVLCFQQRQDEPLFGTEVVVQLAQWHRRLVSDLPGRQTRVAVGQQPTTGRLQDQRVGVDGDDSRHGVCPFKESVDRSTLTIMLAVVKLKFRRSVDRPN